MEEYLNIGNPAFNVGFVVLNIILLYFLRNKLLDFIARVIQNINKPLDYVVAFLTKSSGPIVNLTYRQQVLNFFIVLFSAVLVFTEYHTLDKVIGAFMPEQAKGIAMFGISFQWSVFSAISYIAISTILGFIAFELINLRKMLQGIFFNDNDVRADNNKKIKYVFAILFFIALLIMAILQGELALYRLGKLSKATDFLFVKKAFFFILGFLTPIVAAFAFISIDIFLSIWARFLIVTLTIIQKSLSAIFYAIETVILITSSPIDKLLELFHIYQIENLNNTNKNYKNRKGEIKEAGIAKRIAPLQSNNEIYLENRAEISRNYRGGNKLTIISNNPIFREIYPSNDLTFNDDPKIEYIKEKFVSKFPALENTEIEFKYFNQIGDLKIANVGVKLNDLMRETNTLFIELKPIN